MKPSITFQLSEFRIKYVIVERSIVEVIESLPAEYQIVLRAHYLGNKSAEEIAEILSVPAESVARIIKAGRAALAQQLGLN